MSRKHANLAPKVPSDEQSGEDAASQLDKFKDAARKLGTDNDPERFKAAVRKLASAPVARNRDKPTEPPKAE